MKTLYKVCKLNDGRLAVVSGESQEAKEFFLMWQSGQMLNNPISCSLPSATDDEIATLPSSTDSRARKRKRKDVSNVKSKSQRLQEDKVKRNEINNIVRDIHREVGGDIELVWCELYEYAVLDIGFNAMKVLEKETKTGKKSERGSYLNAVHNRGKLGELLGAEKRFIGKKVS
ncbi:hypothetical protein M5X06_12640 [Paenibacillus alvei]|uniref:Uncharacterized protein n=1 Tax=Paenibacillus alvei TaxID=44250 RepID=A0ABT4GUK2_PAEAL|nr:hypothetical protein [Paenibacillus alvei]MCY9760367.1 hypothetical protein [Paenibacillus alvei]MCY9767659.1 hypothetical protein [Paenibacillus alvei]